MRVAQWVVSAGVVVLVVTRGFWAGALVLLVLLAIYVVGASLMPIWIHARLRLPAKPAFEEAQLEDPALPETVRTHLIAHRDALVARGFEPRGLIHQIFGVLPSGYFCLYYHRPSTTRAQSRVLLKPPKDSTVVQSADVELEIRYAGDTSVELTNVGMNLPGLDHVPGWAGQLPQVRDASRLFDYFLSLTAKYERERNLSEGARVAMPDDVTMSSMYHEQFEHTYAIQHRAGLLRRTAASDTWRPTWKHAFLIAASALSPGAEFFRRRVRVRGARLQRQLDGDDSLSRHEHIGTSRGWVLLAAGLLLGLVATVMSATSCALAAMGMVIAWSLAGRGGKEPDWRAIALGGGAIVLLAIPIAPLSVAGLSAVPVLLLTLASLLVLEGFRAAAT